MTDKILEIYEPTLLAIPDTPQNALLKVRILRPAWSDLVRALARHERRFVLHIVTLRDRGALYHAINRFNARAKDKDAMLRMNSVAVSTATALTGEDGNAEQWLITLVRRGLTEEDNLSTYATMGLVAQKCSLVVATRYYFLVHLPVVLSGGFIPALKNDAECWEKLRNQMRKFIRKRAALHGYDLSQSDHREPAWVGSTHDREGGNILLSYSLFAQNVWAKIKGEITLADRAELANEE